MKRKILFICLFIIVSVFALQTQVKAEDELSTLYWNTDRTRAFESIGHLTYFGIGYARVEDDGTRYDENYICPEVRFEGRPSDYPDNLSLGFGCYYASNFNVGSLKSCNYYEFDIIIVTRDRSWIKDDWSNRTYDIKLRKDVITSDTGTAFSSTEMLDSDDDGKVNYPSLEWDGTSTNYWHDVDIANRIKVKMITPRYEDLKETKIVLQIEVKIKPEDYYVQEGIETVVTDKSYTFALLTLGFNIEKSQEEIDLENALNNYEGTKIQEQAKADEINNMINLAYQSLPVKDPTTIDDNAAIGYFLSCYNQGEECVYDRFITLSEQELEEWIIKLKRADINGFFSIDKDFTLNNEEDWYSVIESSLGEVLASFRTDRTREENLANMRENQNLVSNFFESAMEQREKELGEIMSEKYNLIKEFTISIADFGESDDREVYENFYDIFENVSDYEITDNTSDEDVTKLQNKVNIILTVITNIGMILAVLMSAILGVKYMLGSVEEKADYKKDLVPYIIGAGLLFGICAIVKVLQQLGQTINNI